jgi:hypothetical protein
MGYVGGYSLDLYCDHPDHWESDGSGPKYPWPEQFVDMNWSQTVATARKAGWYIKRGPTNSDPKCVGGGTVLCPKHREKANP